MRVFFAVFISLALHLALFALIRFDAPEGPVSTEANREIVITCSRVEAKKPEPVIEKIARKIPSPKKAAEKKETPAPEKKAPEKRVEKKAAPEKVKPDFKVEKTSALKERRPDLEQSAKKEETAAKEENRAKEETRAREETGVKEEKRSHENRILGEKSVRAKESRPGRRLPGYKRTRPPIYPRLAKKRGYQGIVVLDLLVGRQGNVEKINVWKSSGYSLLDDAAVIAAKKWTFTPGFNGTRNVGMWIKAPVHFRLTD